jgi:hypothetical protein
MKANGEAVEVFYVQVVTALPRGRFVEGEPIRFDSRKLANETCEQFQAEFDQDCDPKRAYVLDSTKVPVRAGGERRKNRGERS